MILAYVAVISLRFIVPGKTGIPETMKTIACIFASEGAQPFAYDEALECIAAQFLGDEREPDFGEDATPIRLHFSKGKVSLKVPPSASPSMQAFAAMLASDMETRKKLKPFTADATNYVLQYLEENCTNYIRESIEGRTFLGLKVNNNKEQVEAVFIFAKKGYNFKLVLDTFNVLFLDEGKVQKWYNEPPKKLVD